MNTIPTLLRLIILAVLIIKLAPAQLISGGRSSSGGGLQWVVVSPAGLPCAEDAVVNYQGIIYTCQAGVYAVATGSPGPAMNINALTLKSTAVDTDHIAAANSVGGGNVRIPVSGLPFESPLTFTAPLIRTTNDISCRVATGSLSGCLSSADWTAFNAKVAPNSSPTFGTVTGVNINLTQTGAGSAGTFRNHTSTVATDPFVTVLNSGGTPIGGFLGNGKVFDSSVTSVLPAWYSATGVLGTGTRTGNTTQVATWTGPTTAGKQVTVDAFGNLLVSAFDVGSSTGSETQFTSPTGSGLTITPVTGGYTINTDPIILVQRDVLGYPFKMSGTDPPTPSHCTLAAHSYRSYAQHGVGHWDCTGTGGWKQGVVNIPDGVYGDVTVVSGNFNVTGVTAEDVGLGNVSNYPVATNEEMAAGVATDRTTTPAGVAHAITVLANTAGFSPTTLYDCQDEFMASTYSTSVGSGACEFRSNNALLVPATGTAALPGAISVGTGTTTTGSVGMATRVSAILFGTLTYEFHIKLGFTTLSDATDRYTAVFGFLDNDVPVDGAYFRYSDNANSGKVQAITRSTSGNETAVDTGVTVVAGTQYWFRINVAPGTVTYYINNALVATITTNIPTATGRETGLGFHMVKSLGTNARDMVVDKVAYRILR